MKSHAALPELANDWASSLWAYTLRQTNTRCTPACVSRPILLGSQSPQTAIWSNSITWTSLRTRSAMPCIQATASFLKTLNSWICLSKKVLPSSDLLQAPSGPWAARLNRKKSWKRQKFPLFPDITESRKIPKSSCKRQNVLASQ